MPSQPYSDDYHRLSREEQFFLRQLLADNHFTLKDGGDDDDIEIDRHTFDVEIVDSHVVSLWFHFGCLRSPQILTHFSALKILQIDHSIRLETLESFPSLPSLTELSLTGIGLNDITGISKFPSLTTLDLSSNKIEDLPEEFSSLHHLECLELNYNRFRRIPPLFVTMPSLKTITLFDNPLVDPWLNFAKTHGFWVRNINYPTDIPALRTFIEQNSTNPNMDVDQEKTE